MPRVIDLIFRAQTAEAEASINRLGTAASRTAASSEAAFRKSQRNLGSFAGAAERAGRFVTGIGLGLAGAGYVVAKSSVNFQTSMERIRTQAGASQGEVDKLSTALLKMAKSGQYAQTPNDMANALYHLESVGLRLNTGVLPDLKSSLDAAAVGGVNAEDAATALAAAWAATGRKGGKTFQDMAGIINAAVGTGNMRMADLVQAMGRGVIPAFQAVGLNVHDAMGAMAVFTDAGYQASSAAAQVSTALHFLVKPTTEATKYLNIMGMSQYQMNADLHKPRGLLVALTDLRNHLEKLPGGLKGIDASVVLSSLFPGGRGRIMLTLLQNLNTYSTKLDQQDKLQKTFSQDTAAYHQTMAFKLHAAWTKINASIIEFGNTLLPVIAKYLPQFTKALSDILGFFTRLPGPIKSFMVKVMEFSLIGGPILMLVGKVLRLVKAFRELKYIMFGIRGAGAAAAEGEAMAAGGGAAAGAGGAAAAAGGASWSERQMAAQGIEPYASRYGVAAGTAETAGVLARTGAGIAARVAGMGNPILFGANVALLEDLYGTPETKAKTMPAQHGQHIYNPRVAPFIPRHFGKRHYATGGLVDSSDILGTDDQPALLRLGEGVLNTTAMNNIGVGGLNALNAGQAMPSQAPIHIEPSPAYFYVDGRQLARAVLQYTLGRAARGPTSLVGGALVTGHQ